MFLAVAALSTLLHTCASRIAPETMSAVVAVESGGNPLAMHDNSIGQSFEPPDTATAIAWATQLVNRGDSVDIGLSQINSNNLGMLGLSVRDAFDPCTNLHAGATILANDYARASAQFGSGQYALRRALSAYNSGSMFAAQGYVDKILVAAGIAPDERPAASAPAKARSAHAAEVATAPTPTPPYTAQTTSSGVIVIDGHP